MTHLRIEQGGITEYVTSTLIHKLYEYAKEIKDYEEDPLNNVTTSQVSLKGNLSVPKAYGDEIDWLETEFPDLHITATQGRYMRFADSALVSRMLQYLGDGVGIINNEITNSNWYSNTTDPNTNNTLFINNTAIISFNELGDLTQITTIPNNVFKGCTNITSIDLSNCTSIGTEAFKGCTSLTSIDLSSCTTIGSRCFQDSGISGNLALPSLVTAQGEYEFCGCTGITTVSDLGSITWIDHHMFEGCSNLTTIDLSGITGIIGWAAFNGCKKLTSVNLANVSYVHGYAFTNCTALSQVSLGQSCTRLNEYAFRGCTSLQSIIIPKNVTVLENDVFTGCTNLSSVQFESGSALTTLGGGCFNGCNSLQSITIPDSCTTIGNHCFVNCANLTNVEIGSGIQSLGTGVFQKGVGNGHMILTIHATTPPTFPYFSDNKQIDAIYVPTGCVSTYEQHADWSRYAGIIYEIPQT